MESSDNSKEGTKTDSLDILKGGILSEYTKSVFRGVKIFLLSCLIGLSSGGYGLYHSFKKIEEPQQIAVYYDAQRFLGILMGEHKKIESFKLPPNYSSKGVEEYIEHFLSSRSLQKQRLEKIISEEKVAISEMENTEEFRSYQRAVEEKSSKDKIFTLYGFFIPIFGGFSLGRYIGWKASRRKKEKFAEIGLNKNGKEYMVRS